VTSFAEPLIHRVLTIDDNPAIHEDFKKILSRDTNADTALAAEEALILGDALPQNEDSRFELCSALQGAAGVELAREARAEGRPFAVAFIDMRMPPGWDGLKTIEELWKVDPDVQVVICSAYTEYRWSELRSRLGPSDKLLVLKKPFESIEVQQAASALCRKWHNERMLRRHVEDLEHVITARTKGLEAANHQLQQLATHDVLTGLPNRVILHDRLEQAIAHATREQHEFAVLLLDLDRFKVINDSLGHRAGDELLKEVALRLKGVVRGMDTLVRLGGDEFVIVLASVQTPDQAHAIATRAIEALKPPIRLQEVDVRTSVSIGIAFCPSDGVTVEMLLAHADAAMYSAKQTAHGTYHCFATSTSTFTRDRVKFESDLHAALAAGQFELYYQPKVDTATGRVHSAEALIRWRHPERGLLLPEDFISIAEECGLLDSIGEWVLREACRQAKLWQRHADRPLRVAVNLSPSQFRLGSLLDMVRGALTTAELEARFLEVELTETAVMSNAEESIYILESLSRLGVLVSVDDFGTGYSSMSYLRRFPIDKLKIDRTFVKEMASRPEDASIVRAMVSLAHSLNLKVVAEGVETADQLALLQQLGCDQYQGLHFSAALSAKEFERLISTRTNPTELSDIEPTATQSRLALG
jgi:diguanylate cyclase (GGDEF)-like protein